MAQAEGLEGIFPLPITKPYNSADDDRAKADVDCPEKIPEQPVSAASAVSPSTV